MKLEGYDPDLIRKAGAFAARVAERLEMQAADLRSSRAIDSATQSQGLQLIEDVIGAAQLLHEAAIEWALSNTQEPS